MMTYELHDYQRVGVSHLQRNHRAGLFFDMGLGKTATALRALTPERLPALVIAPKRVAEHVWKAEAKKWRPDLRVAVAAGSRAARSKALDSGADVLVLGRDNICDRTSYAVSTVILDELSSYKNRATTRWKAARKITEQATYVWGLTGTPAPNGLIDLWAQMYLLDRGARLGKTITAYRHRYFVPGRQLPNGVITEWLPRPEAPERIHKLLEDICISMDSVGRVNLPPVTHNRVVVPLDVVTRHNYKKLKKDLVLDLDMIGGGKHIAPTAAALSNKLAQITAGFIYRHDDVTGVRDGSDILHHNKAVTVQEIVEGTGSPVLVFYRFQEELQLLKLAMPKLVHTIDEPGVIERWNQGLIPVLAAHPASAGHGLNLQDGGHTIVWTTVTWSLEEWEQSNARLARQGQRYPVVIHTLVSPSTVDEAVLAALESKASVQDALLAHLESPL